MCIQNLGSNKRRTNLTHQGIFLSDISFSLFESICIQNLENKKRGGQLNNTNGLKNPGGRGASLGNTHARKKKEFENPDSESGAL